MSVHRDDRVSCYCRDPIIFTCLIILALTLMIKDDFEQEKIGIS